MKATSDVSENEGVVSVDTIVLGEHVSVHIYMSSVCGCLPMSKDTTNLFLALAKIKIFCCLQKLLFVNIPSNYHLFDTSSLKYQAFFFKRFPLGLAYLCFTGLFFSLPLNSTYL